MLSLCAAAKASQFGCRLPIFELRALRRTGGTNPSLASGTTSDVQRGNLPGRVALFPDIGGRKHSGPCG
jgi:hypothetical protein